LRPGGAFLIPADGFNDTVSITTAYVSLAFLTVALTIGPLNVLRQRPNPTNLYLRRDVVIWAALLGFVHIVVAIAVSMSDSYLDEFVYVVADPLSESIRYALFTAGSVLGFVAALILLLLISLSNDVSLRRLGVRRWKRLHRSSYLGFLLIVVHGVAYQILEGRHPAPSVSGGHALLDRLQYSVGQLVCWSHEYPVIRCGCCSNAHRGSEADGKVRRRLSALYEADWAVYTKTKLRQISIQSSNVD